MSLADATETFNAACPDTPEEVELLPPPPQAASVKVIVMPANTETVARNVFLFAPIFYYLLSYPYDLVARFYYGETICAAERVP
jgi:hypothetical protein